jgi:hypothetical protein
MSGAERIAAERQRQIDVEEYDAEHDDTYESDGVLLDAADCYLQQGLRQVRGGDDSEDGYTMGAWPWVKDYWKPSPDPIRNLEKAGALITAEIDRLLRAREKGGGA